MDSINSTPRGRSSSSSSSSSQKGKDKSCNVQVVVRCRPATAKETNNCVIECENNTVSIGGKVAKHLRKSFNFDGVFGPSSTQVR